MMYKDSEVMTVLQSIEKSLKRIATALEYIEGKIQ